MTNSREIQPETLDLLQQARSGSSLALTSLYHRYVPRVRGLVAIRMGQKLRNYLEDEDLVAETMAAAFSDLRKFHPRSEGSFVCWLASIVETKIRDAWRRQHAQRRGSGNLHPLSALGSATQARLNLCSQDTSPSEAAAQHEASDALEQAMLKLKTRDRLVVYLRLVLDMPWIEVATEMQLKNGESARSFFHKAIRRLAPLLPSRER